MADIRIDASPSAASGLVPTMPGSGSTGGAGEPFLASLQEAIAKINEAQAQADVSVQSLLTGQTTNIHETMIALQKADVSFQLMLQVRNKIVGAYEEIMRMQL